ncbi:hypothetical protein [Flavobacterium sp.]|uniref:hypothetical protein n=1 Tax=Flavobacterium sp. TaxID=239 RepID=UPI0039E70DA2
MSLNSLRPILELLVVSALVFAGHMLLFQFVFSGRDAHFLYTIPQLYGFFVLCSVVILSILIRMKQKNIDSVGNTFMLLTCIKMVLAYVLLHPILAATHSEVAAEKTNFFVIFALFLTIETTVAIRLLNRN